jgi:hypothetical protein
MKVEVASACNLPVADYRLPEQENEAASMILQ